MRGEGGTLALQLEDNHAAVVPRREEVDLGVCRHDPEAVVLPAEGLDPLPLAHVPDPYRLILRVGDDEVLSSVEEDAGDIVGVAPEGVHLPGLRVRVRVREERENEQGQINA